AHGAGAIAPAPVRACDPLVILYTSGTTGRPKGCVLGQDGQVAAALATVAWHRLGPDDRWFVSMPLFHVAGLGMSLATFAAGGATVYAPRDAQAADVQRLLTDTGCTLAALAPTVLGPVMRRQATSPLPLRLTRVVVGGGMARESDLRGIRAALRVDTIGGYGQTEAGNFLAWLSGAEQTERPTACGRVLPHVEARVVDAEGRALPPDTVGELQVRGPSVMVGYWNDPDATRRALDADGWLSTGDLMRIDACGYLHFTGRLKELIKSGGENVYPLEVEQVLNAHPAVQDSCVFGVPDRQWGEAVHAAIVCRPGATLTADDVAAWCGPRIAGYKRPRVVTFVDAVPRDPNGKPLRRILSARAVEA
ncbi:MAG TPA: fatty acid--CoA ligase family protein, partial [Nevskiaceae bacterium]|nr:fatty acid--CoA ligase family protein [Nevskiaceae bacterium]